MIPFDFQLRTRIVFSAGSLDQLGILASELGARRALVVSDPGVVAAGHTARGLERLTAAGIEAYLFQDLHENPSTDDVEQGVKMARRYDPEVIVGLGGGSSMDCAKGINFIYTNGGRMADYWGVGKALQPMLPMIAVPTTSGTGSETQSFALISDAKTHIKMACGDKKASFRIAILDPELTCTQPRRVTALTGIDALAHALETYVTTRRNEISLLYSQAAWRWLAASFTRVLSNPLDLDARGGMQWGACLAGLAIENSMLGATHALANPLTARYGVPHGQAIAVMLPHVIRFNGGQCGDWYAELFDSLPHLANPVQRSPAEKVEQLAACLQGWTRGAELAVCLADLDIPTDELGALAHDASQQWTAQFNPRAVTVRELRQLYEQAWAN